MANADMGSLVHAMVGREVKSLDVALAEQGAPDVEAPAEDLPRPRALVCDGLTVRDHHGSTRLGTLKLEMWAGQSVGLDGVEGNGQNGRETRRGREWR